MGKQEHVIKILMDNGALLSTGDVGNFTCTAIEQNNLDLLKDIVEYGGDLTLPRSNGSCPMHTAISEGNLEIVKFLLEQGADIDKADVYGWTARALAEHQGHDDIKLLFKDTPESKGPPVVSSTQTKKPAPGTRMVKYSSEPYMAPYFPDIVPPVPEVRSSSSQRRRIPSNYHNSLFGFISVANSGKNAFLQYTQIQPGTQYGFDLNQYF